MVEAARMVNLEFIVDVIFASDGGVAKIVIGEAEAAHAEGRAFWDEHFQVPLEERGDLVIASAGGHPKDIDLYQAYKGVYNAMRAVRDGGVVVLVAACPDGIGNEVFTSWIMRSASPADVIAIFKEEGFKLGGHEAVHLARDLNRASIYLYSEMDDRLVERFFLTPIKDLQDAGRRSDRARAVRRSVPDRCHTACRRYFPSAGGRMIGKIHRFDTVTSTQEAARFLISEGRAKAGDVVLADSQTAGRGRFGREWRSPIGGLYATFLLEDGTLLPLSAGVAVALDKKKLGGIIVEKVGDIALVGIGINLSTAPLKGSTCALEHGVMIDRDTLLEAIRAELEAEREEGEVLASYLSRSVTIGLRISVKRGNLPPLFGIARGIDEEGRLLVETGLGIVPISSGDCFHLLSRGG